MWRDNRWISVFVDLPIYRISRARAEGKRRFEAKHSSPSKFPTSEQREFIGCLGEEGLEEYLDLPHRECIYADHGSDHTARDGSKLDARCRPEGDWKETLCQTDYPDRETRYVFCEAWERPRFARVWILGWLWGDEVTQFGKWRVRGGEYKLEKDCWCVPISKLHSPSSLPRADEFNLR